jgi:hypothetical protein
MEREGFPTWFAERNLNNPPEFPRLGRVVPRGFDRIRVNILDALRNSQIFLNIESHSTSLPFGRKKFLSEEKRLAAALARAGLIVIVNVGLDVQFRIPFDFRGYQQFDLSMDPQTARWQRQINDLTSYIRSLEFE